MEVPVAFLREFQNHYCSLVRILQRERKKKITGQQLVLNAVFDQYDSHLDTQKYGEKEDWSRWT